MADASETLAALLKRVRQGDETALARLLSEYEPEVRLIAHLRLGPILRRYLDSMDLVQSVQQCLLSGLRQDRFDVSSPEKLVALATTLVRRKIARHWRRLRREHNLRAVDVDLEAVEQALNKRDDPAETVALHDQVQHLLRILNENDRRVVELRLRGYSTIEVARELGLDPDGLRVRLARLRKRLRASGVFNDWL
jgi:RNA polymerase sigma factor (sigma-70 family)